ncbi:phospho-N-acetylmuramoyl-pentapeptide-transferase [Listeria floridensis FSL S10-1187]|uniref:Phospho-N-acetylmuramoyl-pentapeptide-transferase n=1 Tax=Listeria floridensis FSL S10-1187 TaxID=1265817 RepID=A0ABP3B0Q4_9LIST|nr:phospho-N-acetylmuramoyl-pentapeptide-transferase [Listeria floridensis FSL S10-1187]
MSFYMLFTALAIAFFLTIAFVPVLIPFLVKLKFGQSIREEGPKQHAQKSGTPTMGAVVFLSAIMLSYLIISLITSSFNLTTVLLFIAILLFGTLGFLDDYIKVVKKRNLGLTSKQKVF